MENLQTPVFTLSVSQLEPLIKNWVREALDKNPEGSKNTLPNYLTRFDVCKELKISLPTLNSYTKLGLIKSKKIGTRVLYSEVDVQEALKDIPVRHSRR